MTSMGIGARLGAVWARCYTRRLPDEVAEQRRDELTSDLYEHAVDAAAAGQHRLAHDLEVIGRVLLGVPADLSWRRGVLRSQSRPEQGAPMTTQRFSQLVDKALLVFVAIGIAIGATAMRWIGSAIADASISGIIWILAVTVLAGALVVGLVLRTRRPMLATVLLTIGAAAPALAWFWLPPTYLLAVAIALTAIASTGHRTDNATTT